MPLAIAPTTYADIEMLKRRIDVTDDVSDEWLQQLLNAAATAVDAATRGYTPGREAFAATASEVRYFDDATSGEPARYVCIDDLLTCTLVTRDGTTQTEGTDYKLWPYNPGLDPYTRIYWSRSSPGTVGGSNFYGSPFGGVGAGTIAITGTWGYCATTDLPPCVTEAVLRQAELWYDSSQLGPTQLSQMLVNPYTALRADISMILRPVKRGIRLA